MAYMTNPFMVGAPVVEAIRSPMDEVAKVLNGHTKPVNQLIDSDDECINDEDDYSLDSPIEDSDKFVDTLPQSGQNQNMSKKTEEISDSTSGNNYSSIHFGGDDEFEDENVTELSNADMLKRYECEQSYDQECNSESDCEEASTPQLIATGTTRTSNKLILPPMIHVPDYGLQNLHLNLPKSNSITKERTLGTYMPEFRFSGRVEVEDDYDEEDEFCRLEGDEPFSFFNSSSTAPGQFQRKKRGLEPDCAASTSPGEAEDEYEDAPAENKRVKCELPDELKGRRDLRKYWVKRYELFSKYDEGIRLDAESWFSVTPENIAEHIADRCSTDGIIVDAFCGCGGNTIQFAKRAALVIAVDIDPIKIENARHNAKIYGVEDKIVFLTADFMRLAPALKADIVFLSPPWGGPAYASEEVFNLETMIPMNGIKLFELASTISTNIAYYVPRNVDRDQLAKLCGNVGGTVEIETNICHGHVKALTAYYGELVGSNSNS